jgi:hypothetical protein
MSGSNVRVFRDVVSVMAAYFFAESFSLHSVPRTRTTGLNKICCHNTEIISNNTHIGTRHVILAKYWLWLPDDGFM